MPTYQLVLCPDAQGKHRTILFTAEDAAEAFSFVEHQTDFVRAEIWEEGKLLCKVEASPDTGKIWTINPSTPHDGTSGLSKPRK